MAETNPSFAKITLRWVLVAFGVFLLVVLGGVYFVCAVLPKVYTATAQIQIRPDGVHSVAQLDGKPFYPATSFKPEFEVMQSPDVLLPIITDLHLDQKWAKRFKPSEDKKTPLEALAHLRGMLRLNLKQGTNIIEINVSDDDPVEAADIANTIVDHYKTMRDVQQDQRIQRGTAALREQIEMQQKVVDEKKAAVDKLREEAVEAGVQLKATSQEDSVLDEREKDLKSAKADYDARRVLWGQVKNFPDDEFIRTLAALGRVDSNITALRTDILNLESELEDLFKGSSFSAPNRTQVKELRAKIDLKKQMLKDLIAGMRQAMQVDTDMAKARVELLQKEVDDLKAKVQQPVDPQLQQYRAAQRDLEEQQSILDAFTVRLKQTEAERPLLESPVRIITRAEAPAYPSSPRKMLDLAVIALGGFFLGLGTATALEIVLWIWRKTRRQTI